MNLFEQQFRSASAKDTLKTLLIVFCAIFIGCSKPTIVKEQIDLKITQPVQSAENPFLKLHQKNGGLVILSQWEFPDKQTVSGTGYRLNYNREMTDTGKFKINFDSIVLAETNTILRSPVISAFAILTGISVAVMIYCITNPKACFGSCPTFYLNDGIKEDIMAEAFSNSILPSLEANDIDAMYKFHPEKQTAVFALKNEALETHVIKKADLLALPKGTGSDVMVTPEGNFIQTGEVLSPASAKAQEGDCSELLCTNDGMERWSLADSLNLAEKEEIELMFINKGWEESGLAITFRQTLLSTFLFYQSLAYLGTKAVDYMVKLETNKELLERYKAGNRLLGNIEVFAMDNNGIWIKQGSTGETGPISTDRQIIPLDPSKSKKEFIRIKLRLTKGLWRIDNASLTEITGKSIPQRICPHQISKTTEPQINLVNKMNDEGMLVTLPGERYNVMYQLPDDFRNYSYFIDAKGYYLEWLRKEWEKEEDDLKVYEMFFSTEKYLKDLAPAFKKIEADMEKTFWRSKYVVQ